MCLHALRTYIPRPRSYIIPLQGDAQSADRWRMENTRARVCKYLRTYARVRDKSLVIRVCVRVIVLRDRARIIIRSDTRAHGTMRSGPRKKSSLESYHNTARLRGNLIRDVRRRRRRRRHHVATREERDRERPTDVPLYGDYIYLHAYNIILILYTRYDVKQWSVRSVLIKTIYKAPVVVYYPQASLLVI